AAESVIAEFTNIEEITASTAGGEDSLTFKHAPSAEVTKVTINSGASSDVVLIQDLSDTTVVNLGAGNDQVDLATTTNEDITINGDDGEDVFNIIEIGDSTTTTIQLNGGLDNDSFNIPGKLIVPGKTLNVNGNSPGGPPSNNGDELFLGTGGDTITHTTSGTDGTDGLINVNSYGTVDYLSIENLSTDAAPSVSFSSSSYGINEGQGVTLSIQIDLHGSLLGGTVDLEMDDDNLYNDGSASFDSVTATYTKTYTWSELEGYGIDDGTLDYTIGVRVSNTASRTSYAASQILVTNVAPVVSITGTGSALVNDEYTIDFGTTDIDADSPTAWYVNWDEGAGFVKVGSGETQIKHIYTAPGGYTITMRVYDEDSGASVADDETHAVSVSVDSSDLTHTGPYTIAEGGSLDLGVTVVSTPDSIGWNVDNDTDFDEATGATPATLTWTQLQGFGIDDSGTYTIAVRVTYNASSQVIDLSTTLTVTNIAPTATFSNSGAVNEGSGSSAVSVSFTDQDDVANGDESPNASFSYSYDFGDDGSFEYGTVDNGVSLTSVFVPNTFLTDDGTLTVRGIIFDKDGGSTEYTTDITINNVAPTIDLTGGTPANPSEGQVFSLPISVTDPGDDTIFEYKIDWGDGTVDLT
ncbi:MAG: PKD domain-containing protein, partial [Chloroflexi bacterium]|nr:PKD domain-containing protein [Chloroflexota bacterium]